MTEANAWTTWNSSNLFPLKWNACLKKKPRHYFTIAISGSCFFSEGWSSSGTPTS